METKRRVVQTHQLENISVNLVEQGKQHWIEIHMERYESLGGTKHWFTLDNGEPRQGIVEFPSIPTTKRLITALRAALDFLGEKS